MIESIRRNSANGGIIAAAIAVVITCIAATTASAETTVLRVGHFPNITHVQALVGHNMSRTGQGWFEQRLGADVKLDWYIYNAGPSAVEAIFANSIDVTYVGPSPAINAYAKARGEDIRIVSGAVNGGAALVVQADSSAKTAADFRGRKIATPQLGNTQDVSARAWLAAGGLKITQTGGDAFVLPTANPDQLSLFRQKQLDAVWTVEPWVSRLEMEAQGKVLVEEADTVTTVVVASAKIMAARRDLISKFVKAHRELTAWIKANPADAQRMVRDELSAETRSPMAAELVAHAWPRIHLDDDVTRATLEKFVASAQSVGFLRGAPDLGRLIETP